MNKFRFNDIQSSIDLVYFLSQQSDDEELKKSIKQLKEVWEGESENLKQINRKLQDLVNKF